MSSPRSRVMLFPVVVIWTCWRLSPLVTWHLGPVHWVVVRTHLSSSLSSMVGACPWVVGVTGRGRQRRVVAGFLRGGHGAEVRCGTGIGR